MTCVLVVGGGHAAGQAVASLRQEGFEGEIVVVGDEPHPPYQRPPLSKQYLSGEHGLEKVHLRQEAFYEERNIELRTGERIESIDRAGNTATTAAGDTIAYDHLLLATGSRPRLIPVPGADLDGVHYLRTIDDVDGIRDEMIAGKRMVVVGGGYVGLEVAAVAAESGLEVTVLEMEDRILQRVTTPEMSAFYTQLHEGHGVTIKTSTTVSGFGGDDRVTEVVTDQGNLPADVVIVGIGIVPNVELAEASGLACDNGIVVDDHCRTDDPDIYAAGDCTNHPNALLDRRLRLESVPNAMGQARVAAANIAGGDKTYAAIPWFWSDQYDLKLQMVGFSSDGDTQVVRGNPQDNQFARFYLKDGVVVAVDAVNSPREFMACRQMVAKGTRVDPEKLADPEVSLKEVAG
jgi:3-phenylpropionate/trans-cinnamate dioxygenase ferredoxin reductase subunit